VPRDGALPVCANANRLRECLQRTIHKIGVLPRAMCVIGFLPSSLEVRDVARPELQLQPHQRTIAGSLRAQDIMRVRPGYRQAHSGSDSRLSARELSGTVAM
jgi:hypothetical protein